MEFYYTPYSNSFMQLVFACFGRICSALVIGVALIMVIAVVFVYFFLPSYYGGC